MEEAFRLVAAAAQVQDSLSLRTKFVVVPLRWRITGDEERGKSRGLLTATWLVIAPDQRFRAAKGFVARLAEFKGSRKLRERSFYPAARLLFPELCSCGEVSLAEFGEKRIGDDALGIELGLGWWDLDDFDSREKGW